MAHKVKCKYCGKEFDRDKIECVLVSAKRYAHIECHNNYLNNRTQEEKDQEALENYIMFLFKEPFVNARIKKQLKEYKKEYNFTDSGMLKSLKWWFEIKGNSIEKANGGLGILPYIYKDALQYYYALYLAQIANQEKDISQYINKSKTIEIKPPKAEKRHPKLFNMEE